MSGPQYIYYVTARDPSTAEQILVEVSPAGRGTYTEWWIVPAWWRSPVKRYKMARYIRTRKEE